MEEQEKRKVVYRSILLVVITAILSVVVTVLLLLTYIKYGSKEGELVLGDNRIVISNSKFSKLDAVEQIIEKNFLNSYDETNLVDKAITGMLSSLGDAYTAYYTEEEYERLAITLNGKLEGIGVYVLETDEGILVVSPIKSVYSSLMSFVPAYFIISLFCIIEPAVTFDKLFKTHCEKKYAFI